MRNLSRTYYSHWKIWQNPLNIWFPYPKHAIYFTYCQTAVFTYDIHQLNFKCVVSFCRSTTRLLHRITILTIFKPFVPSAYQCQRRMFVLFYRFHLSFSLNRGQTYLNTVLNDKSVSHIIVRRCHFWKFLTEGVCTYNVIKMFIYKVIS